MSFKVVLRNMLFGVAAGCLLVVVAIVAYWVAGVYAMSSHPCTQAVTGQQISPDGRKKAALLDHACNATTPLYMRVLLTDTEAKFDEARDTVAMFDGEVSRVEWAGEELRVFYGEAEPVRRDDHRGGTPITYWRAD